MTDALIFSASFAAIALALALAASRIDLRITLAFGLLFAGYLGLDDLATALGTLPAFNLIGGQWNWAGKICSLLLAIAVIAAMRLNPRAVGLQLPQQKSAGATALTLILLAASVGLGLLFKPEAPSAETLAFQASMPALAEELAYRGIAPALLMGWLYGRRPESGIPWPVVMVSSAMFGLWHGLGFGDGGYSFAWLPALYTFIGSIAYGWMRFATGSLLFPIVAHALGNLVFQLSYLLRG